MRAMLLENRKSFNQQGSCSPDTPFLSQIRHLTSISDLDLVGIDLVFVCNTLSHDSEQLCHFVRKSFNQQGSCSTDKPFLSQI